MIYPIRIVCALPFAVPRVYTKELLLLFRKSSPESCLYKFAVKMLNRAHQIFCSDEAK